MKPTAWICAVTAALSIAVGSSATLAQTAGDNSPQAQAAAGRALSQRLCAGCHLVEGSSGGATVPVGPPSFAAIANKPGQTPEHIKNVLIQPHTPMPDMQLTNVEIYNLIVYIETLKTGAPPLTPQPDGERPKPPART